jgi:hypothetical protein
MRQDDPVVHFNQAIQGTKNDQLRNLAKNAMTRQDFSSESSAR